MAASHFGRYGRISRHHPEAAGVCDRCNFIYKLSALRFEMEWRGGRLTENRFRVCPTCMDNPNPQIGGEQPIRPDPVPVRDPRPEPGPATIFFDLLLDADGNPLEAPDDGAFLYRTDPGLIP